MTLTPEDRNTVARATKEIIELSRAQLTGAVGLDRDGQVDNRDLDMWKTVYGTQVFNAETPQQMSEQISGYFFPRLQTAAAIITMLATRVALVDGTTTHEVLDEIEDSLINGIGQE